MAKNFVQRGDVVTVAAPVGGVSAGDPILVGEALFGVCLHDAAAGDDLELAIEGVFDLPKDTALAITAGDRLFWDSGNGEVDKTATAQQQVAVAMADADSADATVPAKLVSALPVAT